jgi:hypothetical protein
MGMLLDVVQAEVKKQNRVAARGGGVTRGGGTLGSRWWFG